MRGDGWPSLLIDWWGKQASEAGGAQLASSTSARERERSKRERKKQNRNVSYYWTAHRASIVRVFTS